MKKSRRVCPKSWAIAAALGGSDLSTLNILKTNSVITPALYIVLDVHKEKITVADGQAMTDNIPGSFSTYGLMKTETPIAATIAPEIPTDHKAQNL